MGGGFRLMDYVVRQKEAGKKINPLEAAKATMSGIGRGIVNGLSASVSPASAVTQMGGLLGNILLRSLHDKANTGKVNLGNIAKEALYDRYGGRPEPKQPVRMPGTAVTPASVAKDTKTAVRPVTRPTSSPAIKPLTTTQSQRDPKTGCSANGSGTGYGYANGTNSYVKTTPSMLGNLKERWTDPTTMINDLSTAISIAGLGGYGIYKTGKVIDTFMKNRNTIAKVTGKSQGLIPMNLQFFGGKKPSSPSQMQQDILRGQAPRNVERVDRAHNPTVPNQKPHIHFKDGTSLNNDGTIHDVHRGTPVLDNKVLRWLENHGWKGN